MSGALRKKKKKKRLLGWNYYSRIHIQPWASLTVSFSSSKTQQNWPIVNQSPRSYQDTSIPPWKSRHMCTEKYQWAKAPADYNTVPCLWITRIINSASAVRARASRETLMLQRTNRSLALKNYEYKLFY